MLHFHDLQFTIVLTYILQLKIYNDIHLVTDLLIEKILLSYSIRFTDRLLQN